MQLFLIVLAGVVIFSTFIPLIKTDTWWVRSLDFPRGQIAVLGLLAFTGLLWQPLSAFNFGLLGALLLSLLFLAYRIYPYTPLAPKQALSAKEENAYELISMLSANVLQSNRDAAKLIGLIRAKRPDIVLALETDDWWEQELRVIEEDYTFQVKQPMDNTYGMLLYSRLSIQEVEVKFLIEDFIPSIFTTFTLASNRTVEVISVHPKPPRPDKMQDSTERDAELLIVAKYAEHKDTPIIVMGDFNDVAWSHTTRLFQRIGGLLDPRIGRGLFNTFHADYPFFRYPLDHIFHSRHFRVISLERLSHIGSDHFPVFAALSVEADSEMYQEEPEADEQDDVEAKRMIRNAFE